MPVDLYRVFFILLQVQRTCLGGEEVRLFDIGLGAGQ